MNHQHLQTGIHLSTDENRGAIHERRLSRKTLIIQQINYQHQVYLQCQRYPVNVRKMEFLHINRNYLLLTLNKFLLVCTVS